MPPADGWHELGLTYRIRYAGGEPVEIDMLVMCSDPGLGGHQCGRSCAPAGPNEYGPIREYAERFAGGPLAIGPWTCVDDEQDRYVARDRAPVKLLSKP